MKENIKTKYELKNHFETSKYLVFYEKLDINQLKA
jgi:hypothetical protein